MSPLRPLFLPSGLSADSSRYTCRTALAVLHALGRSPVEKSHAVHYFDTHLPADRVIYRTGWADQVCGGVADVAAQRQAWAVCRAGNGGRP